MLAAQSGVPVSTRCPAGHGMPVDASSEFRVPMYSAEFAADPHAAYARMRERFGALVPFWLAPGVPATLVIGYWTALRILNDPEHFPTDPSIWQRDIPVACPVLPMMEKQPNALRSIGVEHARYRSATVDALERVDLAGLHAVVGTSTVRLITGFCAQGRADLLSDAFPLVFEVISELIGCDPDISERIATGMVMMFDTTADAVEGNQLVVAALAELVTRKRVRPGKDITSWLLAHPAGLDAVDTVHQLFTLYAAASEPLTNLIVNTVLLMTTRPDFGGRVVGGPVSTRDALTHVLFRDPPLANFCMSYPLQPQLIDDKVWVPAHQPMSAFRGSCGDREGPLGPRSPKIHGGSLFSRILQIGCGAAEACVVVEHQSVGVVEVRCCGCFEQGVEARAFEFVTAGVG
ncbi:hypothetical protein, partial [Nocardia asiatica]|uniref:hypothetical protein n=1 Tax=Nocardia asiatica TaxID=209252 RepID=UPI0024559833